MWLLPLLPRLASILVRTYYRIELPARAIPASGPVLIVANHPNSLVDPAVVAAVAGRPVRFLAKAPLFSDPAVGWLVRGAGSIPVYRAVDDANTMARNDDMFRAVHAALAEGAAVCIFPEGVSHSEPALVALKTGAARIALGAAARLGHTFPVVPIGLTFREKERFRSEALAVAGEPVEWGDLAEDGPSDPDAVRALTDRTEDALRECTLNLERWEDAPLVDTAEAVYAAEHGSVEGMGFRMARLREATDRLAQMRREGDERWTPIAQAIARHGRILRTLDLTPFELTPPRVRSAPGWITRQILFFGTVAPLGLLGGALLWPPYRLTGAVEARAKPSHDIRATYRLLAAVPLFTLWCALLVGFAGWIGGGWAALVTAVYLPLLGLLSLIFGERQRRARADARRFFLLRNRRTLLLHLRMRQREIAQRLEALRCELSIAAVATSHAEAPNAS